MQAPAIHRAIEDPNEYQRVILRRKIWGKQREINQSVLDNYITSVKGCHASGKSFDAVGLIPWWMSKFPKGKVLQVSPTLRQVKVFWAEVEIARQSSRIGFPPCTTTGLKISEACYAAGVSSSKGVNLQGYHAPQILIICDECPGIMAEVWEAIRGVTGGGFVRQLRLGNPTVPSGQFFDDFRNPRVNGITISAFDTPNLWNKAEGRPYTIEEVCAMSDAELDQNPVEYLTTRRFVRDAYLDWGGDDHRYQSRVLGEFPSQSAWAVFSLEWVSGQGGALRDPSEAELQGARGSYVQVGIDVAAGGDAETVAYARVNGIVLKMGVWRSQDPGGEIIQWLGRLKREYEHLYPGLVVLVDSVGPGAHLGPRIAVEGFQVYQFQAGQKAQDDKLYENAKAEAYWAMRDWMKSGLISGLDDIETRGQLCTIEYKETLRGKILIEPKELARKRGVKSPDRAEALIMAFKPITPQFQERNYVGDDEALTHRY